MTRKDGEALDRVPAGEGFGDGVRMTANDPRHSHNHVSLQVSLLRQRYGLPPGVARVIAEHAYGRAL